MLALELGAAAWVTFIVGEAGPDRIALANRLALLVGAFPIASWVEIDLLHQRHRNVERGQARTGA